MSELYVCLAAGKGTRMGRLSTYLQKSMYPLDGIPFVEYTLCEVAAVAEERGRSAEVLFVVGHLGEQLESYFGAEFRGMRLSYIRQSRPLGTAHAVSTALQARPDSKTGLVWLADSFFPSATINSLLAEPHGSALTLILAEADGAVPHRVEVDGKTVTRAWHGNSAYIDGGLWKLEPRVLSHMSVGADGEYRMLHSLDGFIRDGGTVGYVEGTQRVHLSGEGGIDDVELRRAIRSAATRGAFT